MLLKFVFISKWPNEVLASRSSINFGFFYFHTLCILIKGFFRFLSLQHLDFYFLYFFYISNNTITFYRQTKIFDKMLHSWSKGQLSLKIFISSCILTYPFSTLFLKTNSSWLIFELIKALEIKTSILFSLDFAGNTILSCFLFLCLYYWIILF